LLRGRDENEPIFVATLLTRVEEGRRREEKRREKEMLGSEYAVNTLFTLHGGGATWTINFVGKEERATSSER